jgi:hypothetical protein
VGGDPVVARASLHAVELVVPAGAGGDVAAEVAVDDEAVEQLVEHGAPLADVVVADVAADVAADVDDDVADDDVVVAAAAAVVVVEVSGRLELA